ncbi:MAG: hypothetical protein NT049_15205 [Planctomycetota bacterium]|nr:hypothetical protein [Planctomycetota bacterium]
MDNLKRTFAVVSLCAALGLLGGTAGARAGEPAHPPAAKPAPTTPAAGALKAEPKPRPAPIIAPTEPAEGAKTSTEPIIQVTGRIVHTWEEKPGVRIILVIDGFTVMTRTEQLTARDGVIWFDEAEARKTGKAVLGVYAETGVEYKAAGGRLEKYDSVYIVMETAGEISLHSDEPFRGKADGTELFLRAKKLRQEFLTRGVRETPTGVVPPPQPGPKVQPPGVREAGVPQEITIVSQDDVRQVNFTSFVEDGMRISIWSGGVYITRGDLEMSADNLVIWTPEASARKAGGAQTGGAAAEEKSGSRLAAEAYLEGHVRLVQSRRTMTCNQMYYDFQRDQALAINTQVKSFAQSRNVPVYYYAKEMRQLSRSVFVGTTAWMSTCEFAEPHYDVGAKEMQIEDLTPGPGETPDEVQHKRVRFAATDVNAEIHSFPVSYWPRLAGDVTQADTALRTIRIEHRSSRGTGLATQWHLLKLLGLENEPKGFDFFLDVDAWSKLGPAIGVESQYKRDDYFGEFLSYFMRDTSGKDTVPNATNTGTQQVEPPPNRGRITWRHRQYLPENWEMTLEASYISDKNFLDEFFEEENRTGKAQETLLFLKKQERDEALTFLASTRVEDFYTRTEYYPQIGYNVTGHSFWDDRLTYLQDSEVAAARYRPAKEFELLQDSPTTFLADTIHEVDMPLKAGPVNVVPFVEGRLSYFSDSLDGGSKGRVAGREGARGSTQLWRTYNDVESDFWDVHRLRHVNVFDASVSAAQVSVPSADLWPFNPTEYGTHEVTGVDGTGIVDLGWHQRFQTNRGPPDNRKDVDWITADLEAFFYSNRDYPGITPDDRKAFNRIEFRADWRATDMATFWTHETYNMDDQDMERLAVGVDIVHSPRLSYTLAQRIISPGHSSMTCVGFDYRINDKWRLTFLEQYDFDQQKNGQTDLVITRRLHCWLVRLRLRQDAIKGESFGGIEFQPVGVSEMRMSW